MAEAPAAGVRRVEEIMGIPVGVDVRGGDVGEDALDAAFAHLRWVDATFSAYRGDSEISRLNAGTLALAAAHPEVRAVLDRCERLRAATGGGFDVRVTGALDPSGFVKGWAVEGAVAILAAAGTRNLCVQRAATSACAASARRACPGGRLQHPLERDRVAAVLDTRDLAVATSGAYERGAHVLDPRTGRPPRAVLSVTVAGPDLGTADAYATAAFAMGADGPAWTATLDGYEALTILGGGRVLSTPGLEALCAEID